MGASKKQILVSLPTPRGGATGPRKSKRVSNATAVAKASKTTKTRKAVDVTPIFLDEEPMVIDRRQPIVKEKAEPIVSENVDVYNAGAPNLHVKLLESIDPNPAITTKPVLEAAEALVMADNKSHRPMEEDEEEQDSSILPIEQEDGEEEAHEEEAEDEEDNPYNVDTTSDSDDAEAENDNRPAKTLGAVEMATGKPSKKAVDGTAAMVEPNLKNHRSPLQSPLKIKAPPDVYPWTSRPMTPSGEGIDRALRAHMQAPLQFCMIFVSDFLL